MKSCPICRRGRLWPIVALAVCAAFTLGFWAAYGLRYEQFVIWQGVQEARFNMAVDATVRRVIDTWGERPGKAKRSARGR